MGKLLKFPGKTIRPLTVRDGRKHNISVEVLDTLRPRRTRWIVQFEVQEAASYSANGGLTDEAVADGYRHRFRVKSTRAARQFAAETFELVKQGKIAVWIDGVAVRPSIAREA
jgi:hypothetical protein